LVSIGDNKFRCPVTNSIYHEVSPNVLEELES
jgi:hypothetical protein